MTKRRIYVLYEDRRGPVAQFGPHELLVSAVADDLGEDRAKVKDVIHAMPKKGDSNLLKACTQEVTRIGAGGEPVVAVFDDDRVRRLLKLPHETPKRAVAAQILADSSGKAQLIIRLLHANTESLVDACATCLGYKEAPKKHPDARDKVLNAAAWDTPDLRRRVRERVPTFGCLVTVVAGLWPK